MSDEIYEHLLYDGATTKSVASFSPAHFEHTIIVHGFAKAWSMTGWRLGWCAAPEPIAKAIDAVQSHSTSNPTSFAQKGAVAALTGPQDHLQALAGRIQQAPQLCLEQAQQHPRPDLRQRQRRLLPLPEHREDRPQVHRVLRPAARSRESRRRPRHRLRGRRLHPPQLRHQHGEHRERPGAHRTLLQGVGEIVCRAKRWERLTCISIRNSENGRLRRRVTLAAVSVHTMDLP